VRGREDLQGIPPQLFFVHQGQSDIKEVHWHRQLPGVLASTAADSFHVFKPANSGDGPAEQ
jgi:ribosome assembly protein RRB1